MKAGDPVEVRPHGNRWLKGFKFVREISSKVVVESTVGIMKGLSFAYTSDSVRPESFCCVLARKHFVKPGFWPCPICHRSIRKE